jgi:hypothetical protein
MRRLLLLSSLCLLLAACGTTTYYGVPAEVWQRMSESERAEAIRGYNERERMRLEQARQEAEYRRQREMQEAAEREARIRAIRDGQSGVAGDLVRVSIQGGDMRLGGRHRAYAPVAFSIVSGEQLRIPIISDDGRQAGSHRAELHVTYLDGLLLIDAPQGERDARGGRLTYEPAWRNGARYVVDTRGPLELRGAQVMVSTVAPSSRR